MGGTIDRTAICETQPPRNTNTSTGSLGYDVYPAMVHVTTSQLSSTVSSQRLGHSKCDTPSQLFTPDSQPRHGGAILQAAQRHRCNTPSQLISLVLVTATLELLGFEICLQQAISIPRHKVLLVLPLRCLAYRAVDRGAFAISLSPSRQSMQ